MRRREVSGMIMAEKLLNLRPLVSRFFLSTLSKCLIAAFAIITTLSIFIPLNPRMPFSGLDLSWRFSMNQAVAQNLKFGREIIFNFGPYASIYTGDYNPATNHLMIFGSLFLGLCYSVALLVLSKDKKAYLLALLFLGAVFYQPSSMVRDPLFFSYPLILGACASKFIPEASQHKKSLRNPWQTLAIILIFAPLGLLPLIKGSFLLICGATTVVISAYFLYHRCRMLALIALISPMASLLILWILSGQSLPYLPAYFVGMSQIISGYTEAMESQGKNQEIVAYLLAAIAIIWTLVKSSETTRSTKIFLSICFALFLFISFKAGFVRHDGHACIAGTALIVAALIIGLTYTTDKRLMIALLISIIAWAYIDKNYINTSTNQVFENIRQTCVGDLDGLRSRVKKSNDLKNRFEHGLYEIRKEYAVPALQGTTDIYSYDQSYLLASNNKWNPRPIFQSYQVYNKLAQINEHHLRGNNAPDNVLFRVQPIDSHLPSLEDGLSWPALFDNYTVTKLDKETAYLRRKQTIKSISTFNAIYEGTHRTGEKVILPITRTPLYAEIDLKPTLLGKFSGIVFKYPELKITLMLKDGTSKTYRVLSNMMKPGFFISPLAQNTKDFVLLATGNQRYLNNHMVESIELSPAYGGSTLWSATYTLKLKAYQGNMAVSSPAILFDSMIDSMPEGYTEAKPSQCDGWIDSVNSASPSEKVKTDSLLSVEGWLAVSAKDGVVPDDIFITLKNRKGIIKYVKTRRTPRNDVKVYFKQPAMPDVGFTTTADVTALKGEYVLGLDRGYKGKLVQCAQFNVPIKINEMN